MSDQGDETGNSLQSTEPATSSVQSNTHNVDKDTQLQEIVNKANSIYEFNENDFNAITKPLPDIFRRRR